MLSLTGCLCVVTEKRGSLRIFASSQMAGGRIDGPAPCSSHAPRKSEAAIAAAAYIAVNEAERIGGGETLGLIIDA
jgi:hypothetical protein